MEKKVISNLFCCGGYSFASAQDFLLAESLCDPQRLSPDRVLSLSLKSLVHNIFYLDEDSLQKETDGDIDVLGDG